MALAKSKKVYIGIAVTIVVALALRFIVFRDPYMGAKVSQIQKGDLTVAVYGSAQLVSRHSFDLKIGIVGRIVELPVNIGDSVKKGQVLIRFDSLPEFRSPIEGIVSALNYHLGETVFAQTTVLSIQDPKDSYLEMSLDQRSLRYLKPGQLARISFDGFREQKFEGTLRSIFSNGGQFFAIVDFDRKGYSMLTGMSADISVITEEKKNVLKADYGAIKNGRLLVFENGRFHGKPVNTGPDDGASIEILGEEFKEETKIGIWATLPESLQEKLLK